MFLQIRVLDRRLIDPIGYSHDGDAGFDLRAMNVITETGSVPFTTNMDLDDKFAIEQTGVPVLPTGILIEPGMAVAFGAGFCVNLASLPRYSTDENFELQVRPRSGLAHKYGLVPSNSPGTVDMRYTGELVVSLRNTGRDHYVVAPGDRIAQAVIARVLRVTAREVTGGEWAEIEENSTRGAGRHGSTGTQ